MAYEFTYKSEVIFKDQWWVNYLFYNWFSSKFTFINANLLKSKDFLNSEDHVF